MDISSHLVEMNLTVLEVTSPLGSSVGMEPSFQSECVAR